MDINIFTLLHICINQIQIPAQSATLHGSGSLSNPTQFLPPNAGEGLLQALVLCRSPIPHVALQLEYSDQLDQPPSTVNVQTYTFVCTCRVYVNFYFIHRFRLKAVAELVGQAILQTCYQTNILTRETLLHISL